LNEFNFQPWWVGGSRSNAGHCYLRPSGAIEGGLTFEEAAISEEFSLVSKQRLQIVRGELFGQMDGLEL
jgi:hypothetical protein